MNFSPASPLSSLPNATKSFKRQQQQLQERFEESIRECELQEQHIEQLKKKLEQSQKMNEILKNKHNALNFEMEHLTSITEKYDKLQVEEKELKKNLNDLQIELSQKTSLIARLKFENSELSNQLIRLTDDKDALKAKYEDVKVQLADEIQMHNYTREQLLKLENRFTKCEESWQKYWQEMNIARDEQLHNAECRLSEMKESMQGNLEIAAQVQLNYQTKILELEALLNAKKRCEKCSISNNEVGKLDEKYSSHTLVSADSDTLFLDNSGQSLDAESIASIRIKGNAKAKTRFGYEEDEKSMITDYVLRESIQNKCGSKKRGRIASFFLSTLTLVFKMSFAVFFGTYAFFRTTRDIFMDISRYTHRKTN